MLINLISQSNYQSYNVEIAQLFGLETAVYLNALIEINEKAIRKNKLINEHFLIDRKYISDRTTLKQNQQKQIEENLVRAKIIHKNNDDCIKVNIDVLAGLMLKENEKVANNLSSLLNVSPKEAKAKNILNNVKRHINLTYPEDMRLAYSEWLDVVYSKFGFVSKQMIINAQACVDKEANHDVNKAIEIIHIASANGWKDMTYAVNQYRQRNSGLTQVTQNSIEVSEELF